jgi:zinc transport system permease protein
MFDSLITWIENLIVAFNQWWPEGTFFSYEINVNSTLSVSLVAIICGAVGSLIVANRMAFFSDALAHCSFAGAAFGLLLGLILHASDESFKQWIMLIMIIFGIVVGLLIAFVQEKSGLPSDTVIGVFFAGAIGLGAIFMKTVGGRTYFNLENFLFGDPLMVKASEILWLIFLLVVTWAFLIGNYNTLVFASFNDSLAFSRRLRVRLSRYVFIALLGLIVNLCLQVVGALLVNALLLVPAATAGNFARNMRQLFWGAIVLGLVAGWLGLALGWEVVVADPLAPNQKLQFGYGGVIVVINVLLFVVSMVLGPRWKARLRREPQAMRPAA